MAKLLLWWANPVQHTYYSSQFNRSPSARIEQAQVNKYHVAVSVPDRGTLAWDQTMGAGTIRVRPVIMILRDMNGNVRGRLMDHES
jgi:hypothetical protein